MIDDLNKEYLIIIILKLTLKNESLENFIKQYKSNSLSALYFYI